MPRMPPVVSQSVKERIEQLHTRKEELAKQLRRFISEEEVTATLSRFERLYNHVNSPDCLLVQTASDLLSIDALKKWIQTIAILQGNCSLMTRIKGGGIN